MVCELVNTIRIHLQLFSEIGYGAGKSSKGFRIVFPFSINGKIRISDKGTLSPESTRDEVASTLLVDGISVDCLPGERAFFRLCLLQFFSRAGFFWKKLDGEIQLP
jgi:hypothetical protein